MAKYSTNRPAIVRVHADGGVAMNDVAVALIFGCTEGQIAARKLYSGGSPVENATNAMRHRAVKRRKAFTRATGEAPTELGMVKYWAAREGVGVMYRVDGEETVMIAPDGEVIDRVDELEMTHD
ncbi:hypothetical protein [Gordonia sputi]|uniref:hypothetical protein n=1 Tax=Gordonia sputi TaxID=36823 RepID=UPI0022704E46|nr:hypothetical protein [Gordonia sputi]